MTLSGCPRVAATRRRFVSCSSVDGSGPMQCITQRIAYLLPKPCLRLCGRCTQKSSTTMASTSTIVTADIKAYSVRLYITSNSYHSYPFFSANRCGLSFGIYIKRIYDDIKKRSRSLQRPALALIHRDEITYLFSASSQVSTINSHN